MNAADKKAARKAILQSLREYARAERAYAQVPRDRSIDCDRAEYQASHRHSVFLAAASFAHAIGLIDYRQFDRFMNRDMRILDAKVTRGIPVKQPEAVAA